MNEYGIECVGIIMDGNRRWARERGLPTLEGHRRGGEVYGDSVKWVRDAGIPHAVYYAFSTENWNRSEEEVSYLLKLFHEWLDKLESRLNENDDSEKKVSVRFIGRLSDFPQEIEARMMELQERSSTYTATSTIWMAFSYGGRAEIVDAVNRAIALGEPVTEESFNTLLWTADMPDPDLIIRTSGEQRLSNFVTWKSVYSEFFFPTTYWPAFTKTDFLTILKEYGNRQRRKGQ